ncbi:thiamine-phosphate kinase [Moraxella boevrei]|uniref:thiamine-phosphate kinase n=1 Tax=Faucicola boevrei TaxID=346665 RepID=UPI0037370A7B
MSEFSLIYRHFQNVTACHKNTVLGIGDDCAISQLPPNCQLVSCVDVSVAGQHFVHQTPPHAIGYKSVAVNLSDLASMGATPYAILLGLSLPTHLANDKFIGKFAKGVADICKQFNVELIGGDTTKSDILTISITALGFIKQGQAVYRSGAKVGDVICVSGNIGSASYALHHILDDLNGDGNARLNALTNLPTPLKTALQYPIPKVRLGQQLIGYANAMIDISDGLGQDLGHILKASGVGARLDLDKIPCSTLLDTLPFAQKYRHIINGGDDYELCFTLSKDNFDKFNHRYPNLSYPIGEIIEQQGLELFFQNQKLEFEIKGWEHF